MVLNNVKANFIQTDHGSHEALIILFLKEYPNGVDAAFNALLFYGHGWLAKQLFEGYFLFVVRHLNLLDLLFGETAMERHFVLRSSWRGVHHLVLVLNVYIQDLVVFYHWLWIALAILFTTECQTTLLNVARVIRHVS